MDEGTGQNKAIAGGVGAGAGSGVGGAIAILVIALAWPHADPNTAAALTTICSAIVSGGGAWLAAWMTPHGGTQGGQK